MERRRLERQLECPVCMDQFRTPKLLPCQHTFCQQCLEGVVRSNRGHTVSCPECRRQHQIPSNGIAGFPTSVTIQRLLEAVTQPNVPLPQPQPSAPPLPVQNTVRPATLPGDNIGFNEDLDRYLPALIAQQEQLERDAVRAPTQRNARGAPRIENITETQWVQESRRTEHRPQNGQGGSVNQPTDNSRNDQEACVFSYQCLRRTYRRVRAIIFEKKMVNNYIVPALLVLTISRFIAGAVKLNSECTDETNVAVYLFVKAWFGLLLYVNLLVFSLNKIIERALDNLFVQIWLIIHAIFTVIWFLIGTAWVFGNYADMKRDCPKEVEDWNFHFINFALFLTAVDWIGTVIFVFYLLYHLCDRGDDNNAN